MSDTDRAIALRSERFGDWLRLILAMLLSRLVFIAIAAVVVDMSGVGRGDSWLSLLSRFDSGWYLNLISQGYSVAESSVQPGATNFSFFPLYPLLARAVIWLTGLDALSAAALVSNLAFAAGLVLVYEYGRAAGVSRDAALISAGLLCVTPHNFVFSAVYTEGVFLALAALTMLAVRRDWLLVGCAAAAALSATRSNGILIILFCFAHIWRAHGFSTFLRPWERPHLFFIPAFAPLGLVLYWWFCFHVTGDAFAQATTAAHGWNWTTRAVFRNLSDFTVADEAHIRYWAWSSIAFFMASLLLLRYRLYAEFVFCLACFLLYWTGKTPNSLTRYSMALFPIYLGLALAVEQRVTLAAIMVGLMATMNGFLVVAWVLQWPGAM